jgi:hypothetical protein
MEANGALKSGELLTTTSLNLYGRSTITLTQTSLYEQELENKELPVWYVDFSATIKGA